MKYRSSRRGFTLLEILIVIAVFGLLATMAAISLSSARARMRDAQRISDVNVLRSALRQYWLDKASYPTSKSVQLHAPGTNTDALTSNGFVAAKDAQPPVYLDSVPTGPNVNEYYRYKGSANGFSIRFQTESDTTALGKPNVYYLHSAGIDQEDTEK